MSFRKHNQVHCFSLGREAAHKGETLMDNIFDDELETEKYIWWHEGWEFGIEELSDEDENNNI